jgi:hypothetical protein
MNKSAIDLRFDQNQIIVSCELPLPNPVDNFNFSLNSNLSIDRITDGLNELEWQLTEEWIPIYRPKCQKICVKSPNPFSTICIKYHGEVNGWCNTIQEDRRALSYYSCWYPQECSPEIDIDLVNIHGCDDFLILNGEYNENGIWIYGGQGYDTANIIALKKNQYKCIARDGLYFYYFLPEEQAVAQILLDQYLKICDYYQNRLFNMKSLPKLQIVSLGLPKAGGAYFRKELIVMAKVLSESCTIDNISESLGALLAHEIAHIWCTGADCTSWEDWLNETTAEWSALLYALEQNDDKMFQYILNFHISRSADLADEVIMTENGNRPNGTHTKGTMLFYEIYKKYGQESIIRLISTFTNLQRKDTAEFLSELRNKGNSEIANVIQKGITANSFDGLFD